MRRVVLEPRHHDWLNARHRDDTTAFLKEQGMTLASIDGPPADTKHFTIMPCRRDHRSPTGVPAPPRADPKAYLTGKTVAERFYYDYSDDELGEIAELAWHLASDADEVHVMFNNNDSRDFAPKAAERLRRKLGQTAPQASMRKQGELL